MEKIFFVKNGDLDKVNEALAKGGKVKMVSAVNESIAGGGESLGCEVGDIYAYIIVEMPKC